MLSRILMRLAAVFAALAAIAAAFPATWSTPGAFGAALVPLLIALALAALAWVLKPP